MGMQPSVLTFLLLIFSTMILGLILSLFLFAPLMIISGLKVHKYADCQQDAVSVTMYSERAKRSSTRSSFSRIRFTRLRSEN